MRYRVCKSFQIESGHMLFKHPSLCRFPHGHSRTVEVVLSAETLDGHDMVCDFKAVKLAVGGFLQKLDHAMAVNSEDPIAQQLSPALRERLVVFPKTDPTTEVLAKFVYEFLAAEVAAGRVYRDERGDEYRFPAGGGLSVERVRVSETSTTWAEYGRG